MCPPLWVCGGVSVMRHCMQRWRVQRKPAVNVVMVVVFGEAGHVDTEVEKLLLSRVRPERNTRGDVNFHRKVDCSFWTGPQE